MVYPFFFQVLVIPIIFLSLSTCQSVKKTDLRNPSQAEETSRNNDDDTFGEYPVNMQQNSDYWNRIVARHDQRKLIYGSGITFGNWLKITPEERAIQWDFINMEKVKEMGALATTTNLAWIDIEPNEGEFHWSYVDAQVENAIKNDLAVFAYIGLTPDWALPGGVLDQYGSGIGYRFPPADRYTEAFRSFFTQAAARYKGKIRYFKFWNEPNGCSWKKDDCNNYDSAPEYLKWLKVAYEAIKAGNPDAMLAIGGLDLNESIIDGHKYLEEIYALGGKGFFDAVTIHPYGTPFNMNAIDGIRNVMLANGDGEKPVWIGEYGWKTNNEQLKSNNIRSALQTLQDPAYHFIKNSTYLILTDLPGTSDTGHDYGLCGRDTQNLTLHCRPSYQAYKDFPKN